VIVVDTATLGGTEPYIYLWSTGTTSYDLVNVPTGSYKVVVSDQHGCVDSAEVVLDDPTPIAYEVYPEDPLCYGDSTGQIELLLTGGTVYSVGDYEVRMNGMLTGPFAGNLPAGVYQIRIEDLNDCLTETDDELINPPLLELSFETEDAFCRDKQDGEMNLYIDGGIPGYWIAWSGGLPENENYFNDLYSGEYVATVTDANQCVINDTVLVGYTHESCLVIPNAFSPNGDGFNDIWMIEGLELYPGVDMWIFDRWGSRVFFSPNAADNPWDGTFDGRRMPIDSYHYIIDLNNDEPGIKGNVTIVR
jgi:gliding motility-associated-like protein